MYQIKGIVLIVLLISALTGSFYAISQCAPEISSNAVENDHARIHDVLREKLVNAEYSLSTLGSDLASDAKLIQEIASVRETLLTTTPEDLKKIKNNWNKDVFEELISWKEKKESAIKNQSSNDKAPTADMRTQLPSQRWWGRAPELVLAFASVPMKDGSIAAMHIAEGLKGKEFNNGKRYDESYPILANVIQTSQPQFGHFIWNDNMYMVSVNPVMSGDQNVGSVVTGFRLSKEMLTSFSKAMPNNVDLMFVYASPKFGDQNQNAPKRVIYTNAEDTKNAIQAAKFHVSKKDDSTAVAYDQIPANAVYSGIINQNDNISMTRMRWVWDDTQETDVYVVAGDTKDNQSDAQKTLWIFVAGLIAIVAGSILIFLLINSIARKNHRIKRAFADAITTGEPIDANAVAMLLEGSPDDFPQYTVTQVAAPEEEKSENWTDMMDFDDDANKKADAEETPENKAQAADIEEAKPLYEEYMRLRKENHIDEPLEFDCFLRRLQRNAAKIKEAHHCDEVHFQVHVVDGKVVLKPVIVKK